MAIVGKRSVAFNTIRAFTSQASTATSSGFPLGEGHNMASMQVVTAASSVAVQMQVSLTGRASASSEWETVLTWATSAPESNVSGDIATMVSSSAPVFSHIRASLISTTTNTNTSSVWISVI